MAEARPSKMAPTAAIDSLDASSLDVSSSPSLLWFDRDQCREIENEILLTRFFPQNRRLVSVQGGEQSGQKMINVEMKKGSMEDLRYEEEDLDPDICLFEQQLDGSVVQTWPASDGTPTSTPILEEVSNEEEFQFLQLPDILALQECPSPTWWKEHLPTVAKFYRCMGYTHSHCGYVTLLVLKEPTKEGGNDNIGEDDETDEQQMEQGNGNPQQQHGRQSIVFQACPIKVNHDHEEKRHQPNWKDGHSPAVVARLVSNMNINFNKNTNNPLPSSTTKASRTLIPLNLDLAVASVHLEPYREGSETRKQQVIDLLNHIEQHYQHEGKNNHKGEWMDSTPSASTKNEPQNDLSSVRMVILVGDTNLRMNEEEFLEHELGLCDAWKMNGCDLDQRLTWNSKINKYHGTDTYEFTCRYDRLYYKTIMSSTQTSISNTQQLNQRKNSHQQEDLSHLQSSSLPSLQVKVARHTIIANQPIQLSGSTSSSSFYLSDHFGIWVDLEFVIDGIS